MILAARETLRPHVLKTPLVHSQTLSRLCGCRVYLKMECWQTCGCFKIRGVTNFLITREKEIHARGVVTASSGNHALALAYTASMMSVKNIKIFLPETADPAKVEKIRLLDVEPVCEGENFFAAFDKSFPVAGHNDFPLTSNYLISKVFFPVENSLKTSN